jgi:DNA-binding NtrC family response regulator
MPEMDGIEFLIRVQEAFPDVRLIAMSGGGFQPKENVLGAASMLGAITVLEKPFDVEDVLAAVDVVLESDDTA